MTDSVVRLGLGILDNGSPVITTYRRNGWCPDWRGKSSEQAGPPRPIAWSDGREIALFSARCVGPAFQTGQLGLNGPTREYPNFASHYQPNVPRPNFDQYK
jgi:hypothetical protein